MEKNEKKAIAPSPAHHEKSVPEHRGKQHVKTSTARNVSTDGDCQLWCFSKRDRSGDFSFDVNRDDFEHRHVLEKILEFNCMTWSEIKQQTHDKKNKSCHHLLEYDSLSKAAQNRISALQLEDRTDAIFSMRLTNMIRIIGYREGAVFYAVWYDPNHKFCPSSR